VKSVESAVTSESSPGLRDFLYDGVLAGATITLWPIAGERPDATAAARIRAMAWIPIAGFALGATLAILDYGAGFISSSLSRSIATLLTAAILSGGMTIRGLADTVEALRRGVRPASTGLARIGPIGGIAVVGAFALEVWCLAQIHDEAGRAAAIVLATMLSRWSIVPIGYGLRPLERWGLGLPFEGGISFREFSVSSTIALSVAMGLYRNAGLAAIIAAALAILAMRLLISRRLGGASGFALAGGCAAVEIVTIAALAAIRI